MKKKQAEIENLIKTIEKNGEYMKRLNKDMDTIKDRNMLATKKTTYSILSRRSTNLNEKLQSQIDEEDIETYDDDDSDSVDSGEYSD